LRGQLTEIERQHAIAEDTVARLETERHEAEVQVQQLKVQLEKLVKEASSAPDMLEELAELREAKEREYLGTL
jgi:chromosome segregation ATPase